MKLLTILSVFTAATAAYSHQDAHPRVNFRNFRRSNNSQAAISSSSSSTSSKAATTKPAEVFKTSSPVAIGTGGLTEKSKPVAIGTGGLIEKDRPAVGTGGLVENFQPALGTGSGATPRPTGTSTNGAAITTVVIKTTSVKTIISCAPTVTNCPGRNGTIATGTIANATSQAGISQVLVTETSILTSVICPVSDVPKVESSVSKALLTNTNTPTSTKPVVNTPTPTGSPTNGGATTTLVVRTTAVKTIISCAPTVTNCPGRDGRPATVTSSMPGVSQIVVTETAVLTTVVCPVSDVPKIQSSVSKALETAASAGSGQPSQVLTTVSTEIKETIITRTTQRVVTVTLNPGGDGTTPNVITTTVDGTLQSTSTATITAIHTIPCSNGACSGGNQDKDKPNGGKGGSVNSGTTTSTATSTGTRTMTVKKPGQTGVSPGGGDNNNEKSKGGNQGGDGGSKGGNNNEKPKGGNNGGNQGGDNCPVCAPAAPTKAAECPPPMTVTVTVTAPSAASTGPSGGNGGNKDTGSSGGSGGRKDTGKTKDEKKSPPASGPSTPATQGDDDSCDADEEDEKDTGKKSDGKKNTPGSGDDDSCDADEEDDKPGSSAPNSTSTKPSMPMKTGGATKPDFGDKNGTFKAHPKPKKDQPGNSRRSQNLF